MGKDGVQLNSYKTTSHLCKQAGELWFYPMRVSLTVQRWNAPKHLLL